MRVRVSVVLHLKPFLFQVNWLLRSFDCTTLGLTVLLTTLTCLEEGSETGGFSHVLDTVGFISVFMY